MVQRICPICDQIMKSAHYCRTCRQWVKNPWVRDVDYYLNERHPQNEADCTYHERNPKEQGNPRGLRQAAGRGGSAGSSMQTGRAGGSSPQTGFPGGSSALPGVPRGSAALPGLSGSARQKHPVQNTYRQRGTQKPVSLILVIVIAVYLVVMLMGAVLRGSAWNLLSGGSGGSSFTGYEKTETALAQPAYRELEDGDVIASGEACNSRMHFDIPGETLLDPVKEALDAMGYEVEDSYSYSTNEIYNSGESWFETVISMELAPEDGDDAYQYIEINYDTATGELHEVDVVMSDGEDAVKMAAAVLKYLEDAGAAEQACSEAAAEELGGALLSGDDIYSTYGNVEISGFTHSDGCGIYISHTWD